MRELILALLPVAVGAMAGLWLFGMFTVGPCVRDALQDTDMAAWRRAYPVRARSAAVLLVVFWPVTVAIACTRRAERGRR